MSRVLAGVGVGFAVWVTGCATARQVMPEAERSAPRVAAPVASAPVEVSEAAFRRAVAGLVLDMKWDVARGPTGGEGRRAWLASARGVVDEGPGKAAPSTLRLCEPTSTEECPSLEAPGLTRRRVKALSFALDTVWEGVEEAVGEVMNPVVLRTMVVSLIGTSLVMLVAPEPVTKFAALALTACLVAYLGTGPVWNLGRAFLRLMEESEHAVSDGALKAAGHRFGRVLGDNGARVLVVVALTALGGKTAMGARGPRMPGFAQAAVRAQGEAGFPLAGAMAGEVTSIALPAEGVLNVVLAPTVVAAVAMGPGGVIQGDPDGEVHHICTDKNEVSDTSGGPWTPAFEDVFRRAGMKLSDQANQVRIRGHKGPHPREYHQEVLLRLQSVMRQCRGTASCRDALVGELSQLAKELTTPGTRLRKLITRNPEA